MSSFPERNLNQTAVYWGAPINNGYGGFFWGDPVEIACRWISTEELLKNARGEEILSGTATQVAVDVEQNGMLLLGTLDDLESAEYNDPVAAGALPVIRFDKIPTMKGDKFFRLAFLGSVYRGVGL